MRGRTITAALARLPSLPRGSAATNSPRMGRARSAAAPSSKAGTACHPATAWKPARLRRAAPRGREPPPWLAIGLGPGRAPSLGFLLLRPALAAGGARARLAQPSYHPAPCHYRRIDRPAPPPAGAPKTPPFPSP